MMGDLLYWSDNRSLYLAMTFGGVFGLFLMALWPAFRASGEVSYKKSSWFFLILLGLWMVAARWPSYFYPGPYECDEAQTIAAAQTLAHQPVLYRIADGASAGPLVIYCAGLSWIFGASPTLFLARLTAVLFGWIGASAIYFGIRTTRVEVAARLAALAAALFYGLTEFWNYVNYNSEMLPSALCAVATACLLGMFCEVPEQGRKNWRTLASIAALLLSMVPFAKLQLVPLALSIGLLVYARGLWIMEFKWGPVINYTVQLAASVLIFPVIFFFFIYFGGSFDYFYHSYIANNLLYASSGYASHWFVVGKLIKNGSDMIPWGMGMVISTLIFVILGIASNYGKSIKKITAAILCMTFAGVAAYCVLAPSRDYMHYLLLLPMPLSFAMGTAMALMMQGVKDSPKLRIGSLLAPFLLLGAMAPYLNGEIRSGMPWAGIAYHWSQNSLDEISVELKKRSHTPSDGLLVWGYHPELNVQTGIIQATRLSTTSAQIQQNALTPFYRKALIEDLQNHPPRFIVDDVCEGAFMFQDHSLYGPQCFPEFKEFLDSHYKLVGTYSGMKLYEKTE